MKHLYHLLWLLLALLPPAFAQDTLRTGGDRCGTKPLSTLERSRLRNDIRLAYQLKQASPVPRNGTVLYVPIRPHVIRRTNGTGGLSMRGLNNTMAINNSYFLGGEVQFYFCGTSPDFVDDDAKFTSFTDADEDLVADTRDVNNAMNTYFVNVFSTGGLYGFAYYPSFSLRSTRAFIRTGNTTERYVGDYVLNHELGHNFDLIHTFENSTTPGAELVARPPAAGANCTIAGDELCDTPADPFGRSGATTTRVNGCEVYTGTITDAQGLTYSPQMSNIMSYYDGCNPVFTAGQYGRIDAGLAFRQSAFGSYTLNCPPTVVAAPTSLTAFANPLRSVTVRWQDNANNEMGYFIERATASAGPFAPVGGVGPNDTEYIDASVAAATSYWYRLRPSNGTTGGLSAITSALSGSAVCRLSFQDGCRDGDGLNSLTINGTAVSANSGCAQSGYRSPVGAIANVPSGQPISVAGLLLSTTRSERVTIWVDANRNGTYETGERYYNPSTTAIGSFTGTMTIPTSTSAGPVNMRVVVRAGTSAASDACGAFTLGEAEDYVLNVIGSCAAPGGLTSTTIAGPATTHNRRVQWTAVAGATYNLSVREAGNPNPVTAVTGLTSNTYVVNLSLGTSVTISVATNCTNTVTSLPSTLTLLTPGAPGSCSAVTGLSTTNITASSADVSFLMTGTLRTYQLQYRVQGQTTWQSLTLTAATSITAPDGPATRISYSLTALTAATPYEYRLGSLCPGEPNPPFSATATFTTLPNACPSMYTVKAGDWTDPTVWSCARLPLNTDVVSVRHALTVPLNTTVNAQRITYEAAGGLRVNTGATLRMP